MDERRENSVLFSLKELRRLEDDRVRKEQDDSRARADAERAARESAERSTRAEAERIRLEEAQRLRRIEEDKEAKTREEHLRLQEAERRHRVDAEMRLNEERMRLEMQHKAKHSPVKAVVSVAAVLVLIGGGLGYKMYAQHQAELAAEHSRAEQLALEASRAQAVLQARLVDIQKEMNQKLASAKDEGERERIRAEAAQALARAKGSESSGRKTSHASASKGEKGDKETASPVSKIRAPGKHDISDNPLDGLSGL